MKLQPVATRNLTVGRCTRKSRKCGIRRRLLCLMDVKIHQVVQVDFVVSAPPASSIARRRRQPDPISREEDETATQARSRVQPAADQTYAPRVTRRARPQTRLADRPTSEGPS